MATAGNYQVHIEGDVSGQIAIGNNNLQIQNHGGVVNVVKPSSRSPFKKRAGRVWQRPRPFPALLDRVQESLVMQSAIQNGVSVSVFGEGGIGKTTFLSHMAHLPEAGKYPDGAVYLYARGQGFDDLLQMLFDAFFSSAGNVLPTAGQLRHHLQGIRAVILLDDLNMSREGAQALVALMPLSCFALASLERSLWGDGEVISLGGLPEQEQVELFAREIKRPLSEAEKTDALIICYYLQGHPLKIIQAASLVNSEGKSISEIKKRFQGSPTPLSIVKELLHSLNPSQQKALALLGASGGALIPLGIINALLKLPDAQEILKSLVSVGAAWTDGSRFAMAGSLVGPIGEAWNLASWEDALINYFSDWLPQQRNDAFIEEASDALVTAIQKAGEKNRWTEVIRLGHALERILILGRCWQAWSDVLKLILKAARAYGDRSAEAWALHQLGTRALCLNNADQAQQLLTQALNIRSEMGDHAGLEVTRHNLSVLRGAAVVPQKAVRVNSDLARYLTYGFGGAAGLGLALIVLWYLIRNPDLFPAPTPSPVPTTAPSITALPTSAPPIFTPTITLTFTPTDTPTFTPSPTQTLTATASYTPSATPTQTPYDFVLNANRAVWQSQDQICSSDDVAPRCFGPISFIDYRNQSFFPNPDFEKIMDTDWQRGDVRWLSNPDLEDGSPENRVIFVHPYYGRVRGIYDLNRIWVIQPNDRIEAKVGFLKGSSPAGAFQDGVTFFAYFYETPPDQTPPGQATLLNLGETNYKDRYDGATKNLFFVAPKTLIGKTGWFVLEIYPGESYLGDWVIWADAALIHP